MSSGLGTDQLSRECIVDHCTCSTVHFVECWTHSTMTTGPLRLGIRCDSTRTSSFELSRDRVVAPQSILRSWNLLAMHDGEYDRIVNL